MKNLFKFSVCIFFAVIFTFCLVTYTDFAIKKDGYSGSENFIELKENEVYFCFFGEIYKADIGKITDIITKTEIRQLKPYC